MSTQFQLKDGTPVELGAQLGAPGFEGAVFSVLHDPSVVGKVFYLHSNNRDSAKASRLPTPMQGRQHKVEAMVADKPSENDLNCGRHAMLAWPTQTLYETDGTFVGYVMQRLDAADGVSLGDLENLTVRKLFAAPDWRAEIDRRYLLLVAINLCKVVELAHSLDAVIGCFMDTSVIANCQADVAMIGCDEFQYIDRTGTCHYCAVGLPKLTAPELLGTDFTTTVRKPSSDLFALAVHLHMLLAEGVAPFSGRWVGRSERPPASALAAQGIWNGAADASDLQPAMPQRDPRKLLPCGTLSLFRRAFVDGASDPGARPTARAWRLALSSEFERLNWVG